MKSKELESLKTSEVWYQDVEDPDLWHGTHGVIVNTVALLEREFFYNVKRVSFPHPKSHMAVVYA